MIMECVKKTKYSYQNDIGPQNDDHDNLQAWKVSNSD